jgi:hypothetical protein
MINAVKQSPTISYYPNNQQGYEKYVVIKGKDGKKHLELIDSYYKQIYDDYAVVSKNRVSKRRKISTKRYGFTP